MDKFVITIGRQFGSGGRELGEALSKKLGVKFYDKELLLQAAKESGISHDFFKDNDERVPKFFNGLLTFNMGVNSMPWYVGSTSISDDGLYKTQSDFIRDIAQRESCIIVGRSADYVLRDMPNVISVFVHADMDDCVDRILRRRESTDRVKALKLAERTNKLRANYYNFYTDKRWGDAASYDMCFSSSRLTIDQIADIIANHVKSGSGKRENPTRG